MTKVLFGGKAPKPLEWRPLPYMEEYLTDLRVEEDGRSPTYLRSVKLGLTRFALFLEGEGVRHPDEITRTHILRYQAHLMELTNPDGEQLAVTYRQQMMKYARGWINWLEEVEHIDRNPWVRIRIGRAKKVPKPLEDDELEALFAAHRQQAFQLAPFYYHRREAILVLTLGWGLRGVELRRLTVGALDLRLDWITAYNKGGGKKVLPFDPVMKDAVSRYLVHRARHAVPGQDALIIDQNGNPLSDDMIYRTIVECGARGGVTINPHRLRDTLGMIALDGDMPVERLQKIYGHTRREQTLAYARVNDHKVAESHHAIVNPLFQKLLGGQLP